MSRTPRQIEFNPGESEPVDANYDDVSDVEADRERDESAISAEFDADPNKMDYVVKIWRAMPHGQKNVWLFNCSVSDLPVMERIRDHYGTGNYVARVYLNDKLKRTIKYSIEAPKAGTIQSPQSVNDPNVMRLLEQLVSRRDETAPRMDVGDLLLKAAPLVTALGAVLGPLFNRAAPDPAAQMLVMMQTMRELKELTEKPESDREPGMIDLAMTTIKALGSNQPTNQLQLPPPQRSPQDQMQEAQLQQMRFQLNMFIEQAKKNGQPNFWADYIEEVYEPVFVAKLKEPGAYELLVSIHPPIAAFKPWFDAVLRALAEEGTEEVNEPNYPDVKPVSQSSAPAFETNYNPGGASGDQSYAESDGYESESGTG